MLQAMAMPRPLPGDVPLAFPSPLPKLPKAPSPSKDPAVAIDLDETTKQDDPIVKQEAINIKGKNPAAEREDSIIEDQDPFLKQNTNINEEESSTMEGIDIFQLEPLDAMKMLRDTVEALVRLTGDIPPTPPATQPGTPNLGLIQAEKENVARHLRSRQHSRQNSISSSLEVRRSGQDAIATQLRSALQERNSTSLRPSPAPTGEVTAKNDGSPTPDLRKTSPIYIIESETESTLNLQHSLIIRKFYSKTPPNVSITSYLLRIHNFCPMSTAVYLATSLFLHRLAVIERIIPVTPRNAHRLLLAGLRISMKKLEDQKYTHERFAKVGGVSLTELERLEVGFCFLTSFDLRATREMLTEHAQAMKDGDALGLNDLGLNPVMPAMKEKRLSLRNKEVKA